MVRKVAAAETMVTMEMGGTIAVPISVGWQQQLEPRFVRSACVNVNRTLLWSFRHKSEL